MNVTTKNHTVSLIDEGDGDAIVFLHGAPDHKDEWRAVIDLLKDEYRCIAPDLPGFGHSPPPPADYDFSFEAQVEFFNGFVDEVVGEVPIMLVVHDIGAWMGVAWAATYPESIRGLIVMNTVYHADYKWHTLARIWSIPVVGELFMLAVNRRIFMTTFKKDSPLVSEDQINTMYDGLTRTARASLLKLYRYITKPIHFEQWADRLANVTRQVPTRVIWGKQDPYVPYEYAYRIGDNVRLLDNCGHWVPLVKPEIVAEEVRRFMQ